MDLATISSVRYHHQLLASRQRFRQCHSPIISIREQALSHARCPVILRRVHGRVREVLPEAAAGVPLHEIVMLPVIVRN